MESKRRGFKKSKLIISLYKASSSSLQYGNTVKQPSGPSGSSMASTGFYSDAFMDHSTKQKKQSNIGAPDTGNNSHVGRFELYNYDEGIDDRAAIYISGVRKRFGLERGD